MRGPRAGEISCAPSWASLSELADDDTMFFADTGTACIWVARHVTGGSNRRCLRVLSADERMDFSYVAARKLDHGRIPLVGPIGTDKHSDAGCFSFRECFSDISDLVPG